MIRESDERGTRDIVEPTTSEFNSQVDRRTKPQEWLRDIAAAWAISIFVVNKRR